MEPQVCFLWWVETSHTASCAAQIITGYSDSSTKSPALEALSPYGYTWEAFQRQVPWAQLQKLIQRAWEEAQKSAL